MKLLVCIKAMPDPQAGPPFGSTGFPSPLPGAPLQVNEYDLIAMEAAVRLKEKFPGTELSAVTVGPPQVEACLRKAMSLGADHGFLIDDSFLPASDALALASLLAAWARPQHFDLILCGVMSSDLQRGQTGPMLAELLGLPCATTVIALELAPDGRSLLCERELEGGCRELVELSVPALLTVQSGLCTPRYASLSNVLRVKAISIPHLAASALLPIRPGCEAVLGLRPPAALSRCEFLVGSLEEQAEQLMARIRARIPVL